MPSPLRPLLATSESTVTKIPVVCSTLHVHCLVLPLPVDEEGDTLSLSFSSARHSPSSGSKFEGYTARDGPPATPGE